MARLKLKLTASEHAALDEGLRGFYVRGENGEFLLDAEEDPRVSEFRKTNRSMKEQLDKLRPQDYNLANQVSELREKIEQMESEGKAKDARLARAALERTVREVGGKHGLRQGAVEDMLRRVQDAGFAMDGGTAVRKDSAGKVVPSKKNKDLPMTLAEFVSELKTDGAGFLFEKPAGSGMLNRGERTSGKPALESLPDDAPMSARIEQAQKASESGALGM